jgi:TatD DNase family protein
MDYALPALPDVVLVDTHCHLYLEHFQKDLAEVLDRAQANGVKAFIVPGIDIKTSRTAVELSERHDGIFAAVGVHPNYAETWDANTLRALAELSRHPRVVAIGEIGLDYYRNFAAPEAQKQLLRSQLDLAASCGLPVILHQRQAFEDMWAILSPWLAKLTTNQNPLHTRPGVFHAFEEDIEIAQTVTRAGFYIGLAGSITYRNPIMMEQVIRFLPTEALLLETDSPYLSPHPHRGKRNEPANLLHIAEHVAQVREIPLEELAKLSTSNALHLFNLVEIRS